uniref:Si:dkeyp-121d4.3 n=1 Tax=Cyprinus carpio TaxID=7962 RepID=A0A8C2FN82_CYPCA
MGKNRKKGKGAAQPPGPGPQLGMRGFRGPAPGFPMGPPGQRYPAPHRDFGPHPSRMMMMMDDMEGERGFLHEAPGFMMDDRPYHPMDFPDRHEFGPCFDGPDAGFHHPEFGSRPPATRFYHPELEYGPRFRSPEFCDGPPDFCPPEFRGRPPSFHPPEFEGGPGFHRMNPGYDQMEQYGPRDPHYMPHMDPHGNHAFGERGGFAGPLASDFRGPGPVQPPPESGPLPACPLQPPPKKDQQPPKETKTEPAKSMASKIATFKNISNNCGFIEREDLKKFSFIFDAFFGNRAHLVPGVKVHFTAVKNLGKECAVDVKVAPGGTEDIDSTVYEGVVLTVLPEDNVKEANHGCIRTIISKDPIKLPFGKVDTNVTLLLYDRVEFQLLTNVITKEQRATNIKPKTPDTFQLTKEVRETGVIMNKSDGTLTIKTEKHDSLTASATDSLSDEELNVMDEVELTILTVNDTKKGVRLKKLPKGSVTLNQKAKGNENIPGWKPVTKEAGSQDLDINSEKHEGTITKIAPKKSQSQEKGMDDQEPILGLLVTTVEGTEKRLSFRSCDVITKATMIVGDKVQFNISTNSVTKEECAVNVEILPETFQTDSEEQRKIGLVVKLDDNFGFIGTQQDPQLFFDISEVMEDTKLTLSEKVEFTLVPVTEGGKQAVRIRRLNESIFTSAPKLEAFGVKEKVQYITFISFKERGERSRRSRSRSRDRSSQSSRKRSRSPVDKYDRYSKQSSIKDPSDKNKVKSPDNVEEELLRKKRELMELNELIARKKAIVAMEHNAKKIEPEDGKSGVTTFDYEHVHHENIWMPDLKPVKSILKKQSEPHTDSQSQASASKETAAPFVKSESQEMQIGYHQQTCAFGSNTPGYSTFESIAERTLTTAGSEKTFLTQIQDSELVRKKKQLEDLSESIARKRAIIALEQKVKVVREMPEMEAEYKFDSYTEDRFVMSKGNLWSSEIKPDIQPKKSILKKRSEVVTFSSVHKTYFSAKDQVFCDKHHFVDSVRIWWKGMQGMTWQQLVPLLLQLKDNWPKPDVLIIHLGGNDISTTDPEAFIETVKKDMTSLKSIFPECLLVWSNILSRQTWRGTEDSKEMDIIRMAINESICGIMTELGGSALSDGNIRPSLGLYRPDGVHLSGKGIDTFNLNLQAFLEKWESETNKTETETSDPSV